MKNKTVVAMLLLSLVSFTVLPVYADPSLVLVGSVGMAMVVHENLMVEFVDFSRTPYGRADVMEVFTMDETLVMCVTDNAELAILLDDLYGGVGPITVVSDDELEVWRIGWTLYAELSVQAGDVHPICAEIEGDSGKPMKESVSMPLNDYVIEMTAISHNAVASLVYDGEICPGLGVVSTFLMKLTPT